MDAHTALTLGAEDHIFMVDLAGIRFVKSQPTPRKARSLPAQTVRSDLPQQLRVRREEEGEGL
jgi:hypothetical protein